MVTFYRVNIYCRLALAASASNKKQERTTANIIEMLDINVDAK